MRGWNTDDKNDNNDITNIYYKEIEDLFHNELYPSPDYGDIKLIKQHCAVLTRGKDQKVKFYANGVHQDYGLSEHEYSKNLYAYTGMKEVTDWYENEYNQEDCIGHQAICFWRPIHMNGPVKMQPLALCDP